MGQISDGSTRRQIAPLPLRIGLLDEIVEAPSNDRCANIIHQALIVGEIVPGEQHTSERLAGTDQVM